MRKPDLGVTQSLAPGHPIHLDLAPIVLKGHPPAIRAAIAMDAIVSI